jgi:hypothetical protein
MPSKSKLLLLALALLSGCQNGQLNNTGEGALIGGSGGAAIGALADRKRPGEGALIGAGLGAATGALVGHSVDEKEKREAAAKAAAAQAALTPEDIARMTREGISDSVIINQIRSSGTRYNLNADWIIWLQQNGVSQSVITEMQNTSRRPYYRRAYAEYGEPVYMVPGPPTPSVGIAVGGTFHR